MVNRVVLAGVLNKDIVRQTTKTGKHFAEVSIRVIRYMDKTQTIVGKIWGEKMIDYAMNRKLRAGLGVQIVGSLNSFGSSPSSDARSLDLSVDSIQESQWITRAHEKLGWETS